MRSKLRDEFAQAALTGLLASWDRGGHGRFFYIVGVVQDAYAFADAMLTTGEFQTCPGCGARVQPSGDITHVSGCVHGWPTDLPADIG